VTLEVGDAARGWDRHAPYDVILLTGSVPILADAFRQSLAAGGRLAAIVGQPPVMEAMLIRRPGAESFTALGLFETSLPPLVNAPQPDRFVF
jgi:protein-L-isoaspartate(D-aspartate) O-methyltransferase